MKVTGRDQELRLKEQEDQLKKLNQSYEKKIRARQQEIKSVEELYDKKADMVALDGEDQYIQALDRNNQRIVGVSKDFEEKIQSYKDKLAETQKKVEKEEQVIKSSEKEKLTGLKKNLENNFEDQYHSSLQDQKAMEDSNKNTLAEIALRAANEKRAVEDRGQFEISALSQDYGHRTMEAESNFRTRLDNDLKNHKAELGKQRDEQKLEMTDESARLKRLGSEKNRIQHDQIVFMEKHQQNMVKQKTEDFKVRYEKMVKEHDMLIKELETQLAADMKKMVEKSITEKRSVANKSDDEFYRIEKLTPEVSETPNSVEVSIKIPEHEKENFHLSAQGRNIKMTLSRKYTETLSSPDGTVDKSTRSELFSKEVATKDLLNSNKITQKYDNGVLTYKVLKA